MNDKRRGKRAAKSDRSPRGRIRNLFFLYLSPRAVSRSRVSRKNPIDVTFKEQRSDTPGTRIITVISTIYKAVTRDFHKSSYQRRHSFNIPRILCCPLYARNNKNKILRNTSSRVACIALLLARVRRYRDPRFIVGYKSTSSRCVVRRTRVDTLHRRLLQLHISGARSTV